MQVTAEEALAAAARLLHAAGMPVDAAERTAWALVTAELWHLGSHGLMRLPHYLRRFERGGTDPRATLRVVRDTPVTATYDGGNGLGHWQVWHAAQVAVEKAMAAGIAIVSVGNSGHCGSLGLYVLPMVDRGFIGMVFSNGPAVMPPWGGHAPVLSTSPLAAGIPTPGHPAIVDLATTAVARGTIAQYRAAGRPLEPGWAFDAEGHETIDPVAALAGMLAPLGGAKGYALALVVEALTGAVVGPNLAGDVADPLSPDDAHRPQRIAHTVLAIDPACLDVDGNGPLRLAELARRIDDAGGRLPGSHRSATAASARDEVITIAGPTASALAEAAARVGLGWPVGAM
jgi:(2R)-3-sulfolactate dehydrogenase (NADP+)